MANMPQTFETMRDAHRYAMLMFRRIVHSIREVAELAGDGRIATNSDFQILREDLSALSLSPEKDHSPEPQTADPYAFAVQQGQCSLELARWRSAFSDLYESIVRSNDKREQAAAKSLGRWWGRHPFPFQQPIDFMETMSLFSQDNQYRTIADFTSCLDQSL